MFNRVLSPYLRRASSEFPFVPHTTELLELLTRLSEGEELETTAQTA